MKRFIFIALFLGLALILSGSAIAAPKGVPVVPTADQNGNVTIPPLPAGAKLVNVEVYDDLRGTPPVKRGAANTFQLLPGQGFNFLWQDAEGIWFQLITPSTKPGGSLKTDCSWIDPKTGQPACKYLFPAQ